MKFAALLFALLGLASTSVHGNTWHVPSPECPTIRAGIDSAVVGDTVLVACGTYHESDLIMKSGVTLRSESGSPDCVTIDADESSRVIRCDSVDGTALIEGLTIAHGRRPNGEKDGGGIYCTSSSPVINKCVFFENYAYSLGGGLCCSEGSSPTVIGCTFARNHAGSGGAIACADSSSPLVSNCVLGFSVGGEGIYCGEGCEPVLTCCDVFGNAKGDSICGIDGGGNFYEAPLFCDLEAGDLRLCAGSPCLADSNSCGVLIGAHGEGGCPCPDCAVLLVPDEYGNISEALAAASYCDTVVVGPGTYTEVISIPWGVTLRSSAGPESTVIDAGGSSYGVSMGGNLLAGVDTAAVATVEGFTIIGGHYSGVYARNCRPAIRNCVITGALGHGVYLYEAGGEVYGCTIVGNADEYAGGIYCYKSPADVSNCIIAFSMGGRAILCGTPYPTFTCCNVFGNAGGDYIYGIDGGGNISEDPLLCGWQQGDFAPCALSPCLPENNTCGTLIGALGMSECDCPTYDCSVVEVPGDYETITQALAAVTYCDTVLVHPGVYEENITLPWGVTLMSAEGPDSTTIEAASSGSVVRIGYPLEAAPLQDIPPARFQGFTVTGGTVGGILVRGCDPVITDCVITGNSHSYSGALSLDYASPTVTGCVIKDNGCSGVYAYSSRPAITGTTISGNAGDDAGGLHYSNSHGTVSNSIISFNSGDVGILCLGSSDPDFTCCNVFGNAGGDSLCGTDLGGNFFEDPLFCDQAGGDLRLCPDSPCLPGNNSCGVLIGALGDGGCPCPSCDVLVVPDDYATITEALDAAAYCDTVLVHPGTYEEHIALPLGVVLISAAGPDSTVIDGGGTGTVVTMGGSKLTASKTQGVMTKLEGFTITGGLPRGISIAGYDPVITDCIITENSGSSCTGMYCYEASPVVTDCDFLHNTSTKYGCALRCVFGSPSFTGCTFAENSNTDYGYGGAVYCDVASPTFTDCDFSENTGRYGGVMYVKQSSKPAIFGCTFSGNTSTTRGGAIYCYDRSSVAATASKFTGNSAQWDGGAIFGSVCGLMLDSCSFVDNSAGGGGAVYCVGDSTVSITNCTFSGNAGAPGSAVYCENCSPSLTNCILAFSVRGEAVFCGGLSEPQVACCDLYANANGDSVCGVDAGGNFSEDPLFCDRVVGDLRLCALSPCLPENNTCAVLVGAEGLGACDCPSEVCDVITVPGDYSTIGEALAAASYCDTVLVYPDIYNENIVLPWGVVLLSAAGPESTVILGGGGDAVVAIGYDSEAGMLLGAPRAVLEGFAIRGSSSSGISVWGCSPTIRKCLVTGITGYATSGLYCLNASPHIEECVIRDNQYYGVHCVSYSSPALYGCSVTGNGYGVYCDKYSSPTMSNCTIFGNLGRGVYCNNHSAPEITACTISGNSSSGVYCYDNSSPTLTNCIIAFAVGGDGIYCASGSEPTLRCCDIFGNAWGDSICGADSGGNFSENPLFCDQAGGDLKLCPDSPCLPENNACAVLIGALGPGGCPCPACTVYVVPDDFPTISEALEAASYCDTVLVRPGTYPENFGLPWGVVLRSMEGAEVTVRGNRLWFDRIHRNRCRPGRSRRLHRNGRSGWWDLCSGLRPHYP
jgi:predicted outer membrane repeat protein/parallel beta-helix repeat protein